MTGLVFRTTRQMTAIAFLMALAASPPANAQMKGSFSDADANHDGRVSLQEFEAYTTNRLMAANGRVAQRFKQMSTQDQTERLQRRFDQMDRGHKGYLDRNDWAGT